MRQGIDFHPAIPGSAMANSGNDADDQQCRVISKIGTQVTVCSTPGCACQSHAQMHSSVGCHEHALAEHQLCWWLTQSGMTWRSNSMWVAAAGDFAQGPWGCRSLSSKLDGQKALPSSVFWRQVTWKLNQSKQKVKSGFLHKSRFLKSVVLVTPNAFKQRKHKNPFL